MERITLTSRARLRLSKYSSFKYCHTVIASEKNTRKTNVLSFKLFAWFRVNCMRKKLTKLREFKETKRNKIKKESKLKEKRRKLSDLSKFHGNCLANTFCVLEFK